MSKKHIALQLPLPGLPAGKPSTRTITFQVTADEWMVLEVFSQSQQHRVVTPTSAVADLFRTAIKEGYFS
jgi:hypothetical protein